MFTDPRLLVVNGPTASGKTSLAVEVACELKKRGKIAEIINADSMLVYRGMDIGTAKPSLAERHGIVHHLIDICDPSEQTSVAAFQTMARTAIADCQNRDVLPILVGGSALYVRAIVDIFEFPGTDPQIRARLETELTGLGPEALHDRLKILSPETAAQILPGNGRRTVRALEIIEITGEHKPQLPEPTYALPGVVQVGLELPREVMDMRINERVDRMWEQGLVAEVKHLTDNGLREGVTASRALGYRQVLQFLDGELTEEEAKTATKAGTRRFARKQLSWFRRDQRIQWLPVAENLRIASAIDILESQKY
ncbi:MAG: tRNA (adenosine(37)-N6)-dimethylallyltransferase MiaA [Propionibacteriaceae bacterium]